MSHYVICSICGKRFDRDTVQAVKSGARRYAHYECFPTGELVPLEKKEEDEDLVKLKEYITKLYGDKVNWALVNKQIKKFKDENEYSYSGMQKSLIYFYEIKKNSIDHSKGIGIIPFVYQDAYNYYLGLFLAQQANQNKILLNQVKEITIPIPCARGTKQKLIDLGEWENDDLEVH